MVRFLCVLASPRTGSTHLDQLLGSCAEFNAKAELFHPKWFGRIDQAEFDEIERASSGAVTDVESLVGWRKEHPLKALEALHRAGPSKIVVFKLFPGHVRRPVGVWHHAMGVGRFVGIARQGLDNLADFREISGHVRSGLITQCPHSVICVFSMRNPVPLPAKARPVTTKSM